MTSREHTVDVGAYALGALDEPERTAIEHHLASCEHCRTELEELEQMRTVLGEAPPELFLDGPPDDADLLLQRTLRQARTERARESRPRRAVVGAAAMIAAVVAVGGGVLIGRAGDSEPPQVVAQPPSPSVLMPAEGTKVATSTDPSNGARLTVTVTPAAGWVRLNAAASGIPAGERCRLVVVGKDGSREIAGSWLVSEKAAAEGSALDGAALIAPGNVAAVEVENFAGKRFVSTPV
ncbi:anti-sigma factor [Saccharopolyspora phatthalungensis]|uniref:Anti-sigma factor RsiW n=1 Tax=Saccharopolyspora phatthalungensis TaxID=664693 RepID=A0A840QJM4_9PSEU|nr:zf-HC2 domain-containing protein [Saccharopolyspora phatthalungensis]MBB5159185.1 anti-sigma factor RsiW [Saccharopolyspora phatthalungensis]